MRYVAWSELDVETRIRVEALLTEKQLVAFRLSIAGYGQRRIASILGVSRQAARDRLASAERRLRSARIYLDGAPPTEMARDRRGGRARSSDIEDPPRGRSVDAGEPSCLGTSGGRRPSEASRDTGNDEGDLRYESRDVA